MQTQALYELATAARACLDLVGAINGADIRYIQAILGHERLETTQIYTRTSLRKLLEVHGRTHPAERPDKPTDRDDDETGEAVC